MKKVTLLLAILLLPVCMSAQLLTGNMEKQLIHISRHAPFTCVIPGVDKWSVEYDSAEEKIIATGESTYMKIHYYFTGSVSVVNKFKPEENIILSDVIMRNVSDQYEFMCSCVNAHEADYNRISEFVKEGHETTKGNEKFYVRTKYAKYGRIVFTQNIKSTTINGYFYSQDSNELQATVRVTSEGFVFESTKPEFEEANRISILEIIGKI